MRCFGLSLLMVCFLFSCKQSESEKFCMLDEISLSAEEQSVNRFGNQFSFDLFRQLLSADSTENVFVSPLSVSFALGMVSNGASGTTLGEIRQTMRIPDTIFSSLYEYHRKLMDGLPRLDSTVNVKIANSMWLGNGVTVKKPFAQKNEALYKADIRTCDFSHPETVTEINGWVSRQTEKCIPEIISRLNPDEWMVLVNCLYFQGKWASPFEESETQKEAFSCLDGTKEDTDMMHQTSCFAYRKNSYFEMATFPYGNGSYAMTVLLPNRKKLWEECVEALDGKAWEKWMSDSAESALLDVKLPKLLLKKKFRMNHVLQTMGVQKAFMGDYADLSKLTDVQPVCIGRVEQASFLEMGERETKAAAVTAMGVVFESEVIPIEPMQLFYANRPFLLVIHETEHHTVLFVGSVVRPEK